MKLDSVVFYTNNLNKAVGFYRDVLGLELEYQQGDRYASFMLEGQARLGIKIAESEREVAGGQTCILSVNDVETWHEKLKKADCVFYKHLTVYDWGTTFSIADPDGNKVEFLTRT